MLQVVVVVEQALECASIAQETASKLCSDFGRVFGSKIVLFKIKSVRNQPNFNNP